MGRKANFNNERNEDLRKTLRDNPNKRQGNRINVKSIIIGVIIIIAIVAIIIAIYSNIGKKVSIEEVTEYDYFITSIDGKSIRLDIVATSDDGTILNVEIQCKCNGNIEDRASFYKARLRSDKLKEGEDYTSIPDIISIWICVEPETHRQGCCHEIVDMYKANGIDPIEIASEKMRHFIIELTKLEATPKTFLNDMFTIWMTFIKDPETIPPEFLEIPEVKEAMDELTYLSSDPETRAVYDARVRELNDIYSGQTTRYKEGLEEGEKIGIEKGRAEERAKAEAEKHAEKIEMARKMLADGVPVDVISKYSDLSAAEIEAIKNS